MKNSENRIRLHMIETRGTENLNFQDYSQLSYNEIWVEQVKVFWGCVNGNWAAYLQFSKSIFVRFSFFNRVRINKKISKKF